MKIEFNSAQCTGHGRCYVLAPSVYEADDDGYGFAPVPLVPPELEHIARRGAQNCPEGAIRLIEDGSPNG
ncbi:MAG: ferredoxin [Acidimicrobiaceae bacterium]|jgi:ferredoxin